MSVLRFLRKKLREALPPAIFLALTAYFGWNATQGDLGLKSYARQALLLKQAEAARTAALEDQKTWGQRVLGLRDAALDADIIDERSRAMLNLAKPDEVVVPYTQSEKLF